MPEISSTGPLIQLDGQRTYLGKHDSPESLDQYRRILARWKAARDAADVVQAAVEPRKMLTVNELFAEE